MNVDYGLIGKRIKNKRKETGFTQEKLAETLSVSVGYISQVERGVTKISLNLLAEICGVLSCDMAYFVTGSAAPQAGYLQNELGDKLEKMSPQQRKILLKIADVLLNESK